MPDLSRKCLLVAALAALFCVCQRSEATDVWTPQTGAVVLEEMPRETPAQQRLYAFALIGAGQWRSGVRTLRRQLEAAPEAAWAPEARLVLARALFGAERYRQSFTEAAPLAKTPVAGQARALQFEAARNLAPGNLAVATRLIDQLHRSATDDDQKAYALMARADAALADERYLVALGRYDLVPERFPESRFVPQCLLQTAECAWAMVLWLDLGEEHLAGAEASVRDYLEEYADRDVKAAARARALLELVRKKRARRFKAVAEFCWKTEKRPWAAVPWLEEMRSRFEGSPEGDWAAARLVQLHRQVRTPLPGTFRSLPLPAARTVKKGDAP
jgi:hypothetical protein